MKDLLNPFSKKAQTTNTETQTLKIDTVSMAYDDVHRIAQRNPSLYQTKSVPQVGMLSINRTGSRGMA